MFKFGQRLQTFIFGLSIGLIVGCLFFIFKLDDFFNRLSLFEKKNQTQIEQTTQMDELKESDSQKSSPTSNSKQVKNKESNPYTYYNSEDEINVLKEEVISVKNIYLTKISSEANDKNDSLLKNMSEIENQKNNDLYLIEFRKTPLNSKGYVMTRNRVIIYGLTESNDLGIYNRNDEFYLKNNSVVYKLNYSIDFHPLEITEDNTVVNRINN